VEEQDWLASAHIVVVHIHAPWHAAHRDSLAGALFGQAIRCNERHVFLSAPRDEKIPPLLPLLRRFPAWFNGSLIWRDTGRNQSQRYQTGSKPMYVGL
jgi:hypothetical protein